MVAGGTINQGLDEEGKVGPSKESGRWRINPPVTGSFGSELVGSSGSKLGGSSGSELGGL